MLSGSNNNVVFQIIRSFCAVPCRFKVNSQTCNFNRHIPIPSNSILKMIHHEHFFNRLSISNDSFCIECVTRFLSQLWHGTLFMLLIFAFERKYANFPFCRAS